MEARLVMVESGSGRVCYAQVQGSYATEMYRRQKDSGRLLSHFNLTDSEATELHALLKNPTGRIQDCALEALQVAVDYVRFAVTDSSTSNCSNVQILREDGTAAGQVYGFESVVCVPSRSNWTAVSILSVFRF
jgi:hypothetical protein